MFRFFGEMPGALYARQYLLDPLDHCALLLKARQPDCVSEHVRRTNGSIVRRPLGLNLIAEGGRLDAIVQVSGQDAVPVQ
jgi:hypothetical protein